MRPEIDRSQLSGIGDDYRQIFRTFEALTPDIWCNPHNEMYGFDAKSARAAKEEETAWVDPEGYQAFIANQRAKFEATVRKENAGVNGGER
jgi:metallo-beta-lactamase class B